MDNHQWPAYLKKRCVKCKGSKPEFPTIGSFCWVCQVGLMDPSERWVVEMGDTHHIIFFIFEKMMINQQFVQRFPENNFSENPPRDDRLVFFAAVWCLKRLPKFSCIQKLFHTGDGADVRGWSSRGAWHVNSMQDLSLQRLINAMRASYISSCPTVGSQEQFQQAKMVHIRIPFLNLRKIRCLCS